jgi:hypothetical protein
MVAVAPSAAEAAEPAAGASLSAVVTAGARTVAIPAAATAIELRMRNKRRLIAPIGGFLSTRRIDLHEVAWSSSPCWHETRAYVQAPPAIPLGDRVAREALIDAHFVTTAANG